MSDHDVDPRFDDLLDGYDGGDAEVPANELDKMFSTTMGRVKDAEKRPTFYLKTRSTRARRAIAVGAFLAIGGVTAATWLREDFGDYPAWRMGLALGSATILIVASVFMALRPSHLPALPRWKGVGLILLSCVSVLVLASLPAAEHAAQHEHPMEGASIFAQSMPCMYLGLLFGVPVYVLARLLDRGTSLSAFLAAAAAGLAGNFVLQLHCPIDHAMHNVLGHASVVVVFLIAVALVEWVSSKVRKKP